MGNFFQKEKNNVDINPSYFDNNLNNLTNPISTNQSNLN